MLKSSIINHPLFVSISDRLQSSEPPQQLLEEVIDESAPAKKIPAEVLYACITLLSDNGARVATDEPGCAFERLVSQNAVQRSDLFLDLATFLAKKKGEIPLHIIARDYGYSGEFLEELKEDPGMQRGLHTRDALGRTVSHWLWDPNSVMVRMVNAAKEAAAAGNEEMEDVHAGAWLTALRAAWKTQAALQEIGVGMELPDHEGRTALDFCVDRLIAEDIVLFPSLAICEQVRTYQDKLALGAKTPQAPTGKATPRL